MFADQFLKTYLSLPRADLITYFLAGAAFLFIVMLLMTELGRKMPKWISRKFGDRVFVISGVFSLLAFVGFILLSPWLFTLGVGGCIIFPPAAAFLLGMSAPRR